jgi:hypothetical protein
VSRSFAALAITVLGGSAVADPCPHPRATLDGDPAAVASVTPELVKLGVDVGPAIATSCKSIAATVENDRDGAIAVAVKTGSQSEGRTVSDPALAATWIDSWLQDDFGGPMFSTKLASSRVVSANPDVIRAVEVPAQPQTGVGLSVSAAFDQSWMFDGSSWTGITAGVCAKIDALCFGARGRYATNSELFGQTAAARSDLSVLATASYETHVGRIAIVPELGLGVGRDSTSRIDGCRHVQTCDPNTPGCMVPPDDHECTEHDPEHAYTINLGDHMSASTVTPRAAASVRGAIAIANHLWLDGSASLMVSPFAHTRHYDLPMGTPLPFEIPADQLALPGESIGTFELGIGLRWETR